MTMREVRDRAEKFCNENCVDSYPVPIVQLCNNRGLQVFEEYLSPEVSCIIMVDEENMNEALKKKYGCNKFIVVNLVENAMRRRFTIAHELAHFKEGSIPTLIGEYNFQSADGEIGVVFSFK